MNTAPGRHTIHAAQHHHGWNHAFPPIRHVAPGETIVFETVDSSGGQLSPRATVETVRALDFGLVNPVTGPVFVDGAEPGDALRVAVEHFAPVERDGAAWGWTANIPGFGLLADEFPDPALHLWQYDASSRTPALFGSFARVPLKPFAGTIGVAPREPGLHSIVPPRRIGGNLDIRDLAAGTTLVLPVEVPGALFSVGDTHAAQGDGEVCGTAIESPMAVALRFEIVKGGAPRFPRFELPGPPTSHLDARGYDVTTGIGPDLLASARDAVREAIDLLTARHGMTAVEAYMLASVAADLRISEIVDVPNVVVSLYIPRALFD